MKTPTNKETTASPAKLLANLINAQKSTGPKTEAGKSRSKMNAMRHGLTGQFCVMHEADRVAYLTFEEKLLKDYSPVGARETQLVITIVQNNWRLNRARALELNLYGVTHNDYAEDTDANSPEVESAVTQTRAWLDHSHAIANLTLYEHRIENMIAKTEKRLEALQSARKANEQKALEEAELLVCAAAMKADFNDDPPQPEHNVEVNGVSQSGLIATQGLPPGTIEVNGFVFSASAVAAGLKRKAALAEARFYKNQGWDASVLPREVPFWPVTAPNPLPKAA